VFSYGSQPNLWRPPNFRFYFVPAQQLHYDLQQLHYDLGPVYLREYSEMAPQCLVKALEIRADQIQVNPAVFIETPGRC
jgi:hypothetical protein